VYQNVPELKANSTAICTICKIGHVSCALSACMHAFISAEVLHACVHVCICWAIPVPIGVVIWQSIRVVIWQSIGVVIWQSMGTSLAHYVYAYMYPCMHLYVCMYACIYMHA
jgi:hypothetical protein